MLTRQPTGDLGPPWETRAESCLWVPLPAWNLCCLQKVGVPWICWPWLTSEETEDCSWITYSSLLCWLRVPIKLSSHIFEADGDAPFAFSSFHIPASKLPFPSSTIGNWLWFHVRTHWSCQCLPSRLSLFTIPFIILFPCLISDMSTDLLFSCAQYQSVEPS